MNRTTRTMQAAVFCAMGVWLSGPWALCGAEAKLSEEPLLWDKSINLRAGFGHKDNVVLSPARKQSSAFAAAGFDAMVFRLPIDGPQFTLFLTGDDYRYLRDVGVDKEQTFIAVSKIESEFGQHWAAGLGLQYFYQNQVFDVSATEADLTTIQLKGHGIKATPSVTRKLSDLWRLLLEFPVTRQYLAEPLDDYWEGGPKATIERQYGNRSSVGFSYAYDWRPYDGREQTDAQGNPLAGTSLDFRRHHIELANRHHWDQKRRWRTDTKVGLELNADNGDGFFDYHRYQLSEQLRYTAASWNMRVQARANYYDYSIQPISFGSSETRHLTTFTLTVRGEKNLTKKLKLYAEYEHEQNLSNRASNEYQANTLVAGLDWEW